MSKKQPNKPSRQRQKKGMQLNVRQSVCHTAKILLTCLLSFGASLATFTNAQGLRISEAMSANATVLADNYGNYSDWVELHNSSATAINLAGYGLSDDTDEPFKWVLPELYLGPGEYLVVFASGKDETWLTRLETVIDQGDSWKYWVGTTAPPVGWQTVDFDASGWPTGPSGFGFGDGDDATVIPAATSVFIRNTFSFDPTRADGALIHVDYDDGYTLYVNGRELTRRFLPAGANHDTPASRGREAGLYRGQPALMDVHWLKSEELNAGLNSIAIAGHTYSVDNSQEADWVEAADLSLTAFVSLRFNPENVPADIGQPSDKLWFVLPKLHSNFNLSQNGEAIVLSAPDSTLIDTVTLDAMPADVSQGRSLSGDWQYLSSATPGWANTNGLTAQVAAPSITVAGGLYDGTVNVTLSNNEPGATIHYTLDGATPNTAYPSYSGAIPVGRTAVLRAQAFREGYLPSDVVTQTYLIAESPTLPVVSIATSSSNLWDETNGIYVAGPHAEANYRETNYHQRWTRPAHVEFFEPDGTLGFRADVGLELFGGSARRHARKSFEIKTSGEYGSGKMEHAIFPGYTVTSFENLILRSSSNDWQHSLFRDALTQSLLSEIGLDTHAYRPAVLYVNGEYWGIYNLREKMDAEYLKQHYGVKGGDIDLIEGYIGNDGELEGEIKRGSLDAYKELISFVQTNDMSNPAHYQTVKTQVDIDNFISYSAAQIYIDNEDWPGRNVRLWRPTAPGGKWRWLVYDLDFAFGLRNDASANTLNNVLNEGRGAYGEDWLDASTLLRELLKNAEFRALFIQKMDALASTVFAPSYVSERVDTFSSAIAAEIPRHLSRWGEAQWAVKTPGDWQAATTAIKTFAAQRPAYINQQLIAQFGEAEVQRARASAGPTSSTAVALRPVYTKELLAQASNSGVVINEINYNSADTNDSEDWLELHNPGSAAVDLSGWQLKDSQDDTPFVIPVGTVLEAGGFLVLCRNTELFLSVHALPCLGNWDFGLKGGGEAVRLFSATGELVDALEYSDEAPWASAADGEGMTLELVSPNLDNALATSWAASATTGGTPGVKNSTMSTGTN